LTLSRAKSKCLWHNLAPSSLEGVASLINLPLSSLEGVVSFLRFSSNVARAASLQIAAISAPE